MLKFGIVSVAVSDNVAGRVTWATPYTVDILGVNFADVQNIFGSLGRSGRRCGCGVTGIGILIRGNEGGRMRYIIVSGVRDWIGGCCVKVVVICFGIVGPGRC
jgi:hypothetical protein